VPFKQKVVESGLKKKGFGQSEAAHHRYFYYHTLDGLKTSVYTYTSHGNKEIGDYLIAQMAKQCQLSKREFENLIECPLKQPEYEKLLLKSGKIRL